MFWNGSIAIKIVLILPFILTGWNIFAFIECLIKKKERNYRKAIEIAAICIGLAYLRLYFETSNVTLAKWNVQLCNNQLHSMIFPDTFITVCTFSLIGLAGYIIIRFIPAHRQSPIVSALGISAIYIEIGLCTVWCIQTARDFFLILLPANCIIILIKTVYLFIRQKNTLLQNGTAFTKYKKLSNIINNANNLPWIALIFMIPLLGIAVIILSLFGQEPNSIIKAWTETADWTLSQQIAPQNISYDEHYLCTVAAGGHKRVVKPIRTGLRHGHRVIVNRQLCIANAFEQVLEEKVPILHTIIRKVYDSTGYPLSKHIRSKYIADLIYLLMKPLEWIFLFVLYTVDINPENRIAVQYPHSPIIISEK